MAERLGTSALRNAWAPACKGPFVTLDYGTYKITVDKRTVEVWNAVDAIMRKHKYPVRRADTGAYNCRKITGGNNYSLHAYGIAVDYNWQTNPYGKRLITDMPPAMVEEIKNIALPDGTKILRWGGDYSRNKDAMHFEIVVSPQDLATFSGGSASTDDEDEPMTEAEIRIYQRRLGILAKAMNDADYDPGKPDGQMGPATKKALAAWQADRGLDGTQEFDRGTRDSINMAMVIHHHVPNALKKHEAAKH